MKKYITIIMRSNGQNFIEQQKYNKGFALLGAEPSIFPMRLGSETAPDSYPCPEDTAGVCACFSPSIQFIEKKYIKIEKANGKSRNR